MVITWQNTKYYFRECDTKGMTEEDVQKAADESGRLRYEPNMAWLMIPGIGYGLRKD